MEPVLEGRERALKTVADLPPFSPVLDRLLATLSTESVSLAHVSSIIEMDTVIAGNVLKLVNSVLYGRRGTVNSVRHAAALLGINKLRNAVFAMSLTRLWSKVHVASGWSMARFNLHSVGCGLICDSLVQRLPVEYPEGAFAAGLFHDLGQLLIAVGLPEEYHAIQALYSSGFGSIVDCETEVIGVSHAELSADALAGWNLPVAIQEAVRTHHDSGTISADRKGRKYSLGLVVRCANEYLNAAGASLLDKEGISPPAVEAFAPLGIEIAAAEFLDEFKTELAALSELFH